jgi:hypothetical protein
MNVGINRPIFLTTKCISEPNIVLSIVSDYLPQQHSPPGISNGNILRCSVVPLFLSDYLNEQHISDGQLKHLGILRVSY